MRPLQWAIRSFGAIAMVSFLSFLVYWPSMFQCLLVAGPENSNASFSARSADGSSVITKSSCINCAKNGDESTTFTATGSTATATAATATAAQYCQWTVIIGDSNNRNSFYQWKNQEVNWASARQDRTILQARRSPLLYQKAGDSGHLCQERWSDQEMVIISSQGNCHIVTSKFQIDQVNSLKRVVADMSNTSYCGSELSDPLQDYYTKLNQNTLTTNTNLQQQQQQQSSVRFQRPPHPTLIWFSTGFWSVHIENRTAYPSMRTPDAIQVCEDRFQPQLQAFDTWQHYTTTTTTTTPKSTRSSRLIWQTLFPIHQHEHVTNAMLQWDYACQKYLASRHGVEIADLYRAVKTSPVNLVGDYHMATAQAYLDVFVRRYWDACCGGWETYQGSLVQ